MKLRKLLKELLTEELDDVNVTFTTEYKKGKVDVYVKPTDEQLEKTNTKTPRAIITKNGLIYTVSEQDEFWTIHEDLVKFFSNRGVIPKTYNHNWWFNINSSDEFLCIIREKGIWKLSESYSISEQKKEEFYKKIKEKYKNIRI